MGKHAIIVIKNNENEYLQYFDKMWNSYLFLNLKLTDESDIEVIKDKISDEFNVNKDMVNVTLVGRKQHRKFSESAKIEKEYVHYFYDVKVNLEKEKFNEKYFKNNNVEYKWFSYNDLINDERIMQVNTDIVQFVKEFNI